MITCVILRVPNFPTYFSTCFGNEGSIIDPLTRAVSHVGFMGGIDEQHQRADASGAKRW